MQLVASGEMDKKNHEWLTALTRDAQVRDIRNFLNSARGLETRRDKMLADSVLQVSIEANRRKYDQAKEDEEMCEALKELFAPEVEQLEKKISTVTAERDWLLQELEKVKAQLEAKKE